MAAPRFRIVMLVDDSEIDNLINQKMIEASGIAEIIYTQTGARSAIEFLKNIEKTGNYQAILPEVIFLDIDMPLMDGFQFLDEFEVLREETRKRIRIVMLTSSINPQDYSRSMKYSSVILFLNKPLAHESILQLPI